MNKEELTAYLQTKRTEVGIMLRTIRTDVKHLDQKEVSELTGITQANISNIERGRYNLTIDVLQRLLQVYDYDLQITPTPHYEKGTKMVTRNV